VQPIATTFGPLRFCSCVVLRKNTIRASGGYPLQPVFMVQASKNRLASNHLVSRQAMAMGVLRRRRRSRRRNPRPEAHVDPGVVVVRNPASQNLP
jgi:hypothetical protein